MPGPAAPCKARMLGLLSDVNMSDIPPSTQMTSPWDTGTKPRPGQSPRGPHLCDEEGLQAALVLCQQQWDVVVHLLPQVVVGQQEAQHGLQGLDDPMLHLPQERGFGLLGPGPPARPRDVSPVYRIKGM